MSDVRIATVINPYYMNKPNRAKLRERYLEPYLSMGDAVRYNGNGRINAEILQLEKDVDKIVTYTSQTTLDHPSIAPQPSPEVIERATKIATKALGEKFTKAKQRNKEYILDSVHSIYGYGNTPSNIIFIYTGKETHHELDKFLYSSAITIAKASGIRLVFIDAISKKEVKHEKPSQIKSDATS